jgi:cephalosporin-C deacetylase-like acetyl esterase
MISSILGGTMVVDHFARYYAGRGYVAALIHRKRLYWKDGEDFRQVEDYMRTSVIRLREALDWVSAQPEVDPQRIGAFGISYGAILHSLLAAVDDRIRYNILAMPAGQIADVIMECPDKAITKIVKKLHKELGYPLETIHTELQRNVVTDPLYLAPYVPKKKIQIYIAYFDRVVGSKRSFHLWRAMGRPELRILPFGHYGGVLILPYLETASYLSFKRHLC